jgi:hypothetical protein
VSGEGSKTATCATLSVSPSVDGPSAQPANIIATAIAGTKRNGRGLWRRIRNDVAVLIEYDSLLSTILIPRSALHFTVWKDSADRVNLRSLSAVCAICVVGARRSNVVWREIQITAHTLGASFREYVNDLLSPRHFVSMSTSWVGREGLNIVEVDGI